RRAAVHRHAVRWGRSVGDGGRAAAGGARLTATALVLAPEKRPLAAVTTAGELAGDQKQGDAGGASKHGVTPLPRDWFIREVSRVHAFNSGLHPARGKYSPVGRGCNVRRRFRRSGGGKRRRLYPSGKMR